MTLTIASEHTIDVLVIGAGGAGLRAGIEIKQQGVSVLVVGKETLGAAHTCMAEGGFNVALTDVNPANHPDIHLRDTLEGGAYLNRGSLVRAMAYEAPDRVRDLERYGAIFDRDDNGKIIQRFSGKQTQPHTIFVGDYSGQAIMWALVEQTRRLGITVWAEHFVTALFREPGNSDPTRSIAGATVLDQHTGDIKLVRAKAIILCTGGGGRMYKVSTNAASNTADGYALALRVGAELVDMEMVQFHPTGMVTPSSMRGKLVTEGVRGEGGRLFNKNGERFMERYNPQRLELAGRDEVARAIFTEVQEGRGTAVNGAYLSVAHLPAHVIEERLPTMLEQFLAVGVDIRKEPMQIHPSMHHMMGGVRTDDQGATNVPGLYAAGEVAGGDHGGNRLGGNALASCQVMGRRAATGAAAWAKGHETLPEVDHAEVTRQLGIIAAQLGVDSAVTISTHRRLPPDVLHEQLQTLMWDKVGIKRDQAQLDEAAKELAVMRATLEESVSAAGGHTAFNREWVACMELENMIDIARTIVFAAGIRQESRGAHYRYDYPGAVDAWDRTNIVLRYDLTKPYPEFLMSKVNQSAL